MRMQLVSWQSTKIFYRLPNECTFVSRALVIASAMLDMTFGRNSKMASYPSLHCTRHSTDFLFVCLFLLRSSDQQVNFLLVQVSQRQVKPLCLLEELRALAIGQNWSAGLANGTRQF